MRLASGRHWARGGALVLVCGSLAGAELEVFNGTGAAFSLSVGGVSYQVPVGDNRLFCAAGAIGTNAWPSSALGAARWVRASVDSSGVVVVHEWTAGAWAAVAKGFSVGAVAVVLGWTVRLVRALRKPNFDVVQ